MSLAQSILECSSVFFSTFLTHTIYIHYIIQFSYAPLAGSSPHPPLHAPPTPAPIARSIISLSCRFAAADKWSVGPRGESMSGRNPCIRDEIKKKLVLMPDRLIRENPLPTTIRQVQSSDGSTSVRRSRQHGNDRPGQFQKPVLWTFIVTTLLIMMSTLTNDVCVLKGE